MACKRSRLAHNTWVATESADEAADNVVHSNALFKYVVEKYVSGRFTRMKSACLLTLSVQPRDLGYNVSTLEPTEATF